MEWAPSSAVQPQTNSMESSEYIGSVGRSREADACFKVRRDQAGFSPTLDSQLLQCNQTGHWASGDLFSTRVLSSTLTVAFQIVPTLLVRVNRSAPRVPRQGARPALAISVAKKVTGPVVRHSHYITRTAVAH